MIDKSDLLQKHACARTRTGDVRMSDGETTTSVRDRLLRDRRSLLDLSTRNRLLNVPMRTRNVRTIELVDERSAEIYRLLQDGKGLGFLPGRNLTEEERAELAEDDVETGGIPQPEDDAADERGFAKRHSDLSFRPASPARGCRSACSTSGMTRARSRRSRESTFCSSASACCAGMMRTPPMSRGTRH